MAASISHDPTSNVFTIIADDGEMMLGVGITHAKEILKREPFLLSEPQAREAVLQAFSRIGAPFSLEIIKKIASGRPILAVNASEIMALALSGDTARSIRDEDVTDDNLTQNLARATDLSKKIGTAFAQMSDAVKRKMATMGTEQKADKAREVGGMADVLTAIIDALRTVGRL
jgi:hypothetical protein